MFDKALFKLPGMPAAFALLCLSSLVQAALVIAQSLALAQALASFWYGQTIQSQVPQLLAFAGCFTARNVIALAQAEALDRFSQSQASNLRSQLLVLVFSEKTSLARNIGTAATAQAATSDVDDIARFIRVLPPRMCAIVGVSAPILFALFVIDWVSGLIALIAFPVVFAFMYMLGRQAKDRAEKRYGESQRLSNHFIDTLRGIDSIKALGAGKRMAKSVHDSSERLRIATVRTLSVATLSSAVLDLITVFGVAAVAMMLAFRLMDGSIALGPALASLMLVPEYFAPVRSFASEFHASLDGRAALGNVLALLESQPVGERESAARAPVWSESDSLEADSITYTYADGNYALREALFACKGFVKVGVVGESGAGKSTLVNLLAGFTKPSSGHFKINGISVNLDDDTWTSQLHYIPQHPHLFHMTLEDNIRFYSPKSSREDVVQAVDAMGLDRLVSDLPEGLDTVIGEGGRSLSGGEAQRIALARAFLDKRRILLFDEPTAHLDLETEIELKHRMLPLMEGRLVFFATHRLHWIADMDFVIVLDNGRIVEAGVPSELLSHDGPLRNFVNTERKAACA